MHAPGLFPLLIVLVIVILLFGTKKLRNMGGDLGAAFRNFKQAMRDDDENKPANSQKITQSEGRVIDSEAKEKDKV
jgi:sec-independent protein translocase protein TatA